MLKFDIESGPLQSHRYAQCSWHKHSDTMVTFVSYNSDIFDAELTEYGLTFHPHKTTPRYSITTAKQTLWALYELGYNYKEAHAIIDGLCKGCKVKA